MRAFVAMFALLPAFASAQILGTDYITSGDLAGASANLQGTIAGDGFTATLFGFPLPLLSGATVAGQTDFSMVISPPAGRDQGLYLNSISGPIALTAQGLFPVVGPFGIQETGELASSLIDITRAGTYMAPFTMSADVPYGAAGATSPKGYVNFVGRGTVTVDIAPAQCSGGACGGMHVSHVDYKFVQAPELDPASLGGALMLVGGSLLVIRGRRLRAVN